MPKKPYVRTLMESMLKCPKYCWIFAAVVLSNFFINLKSFSSKNSVLVVSQISRLFLNVLISDCYVFFLGKSECLTKSIQMIFSPKRKIFSIFFSPFLISASNFEYFEKKVESHSLFISEVIDCEKRD